MGIITRRLFRNPVFTVIAVGTLAIGIGANAAIFSLVNGILLRPLPFDQPDELVGVWHTAPGIGYDEVNQSPALHYTYLDEGRSFESLGMWDNGSVSVVGLDEPEEVEAMFVTYTTFEALRIQPAIGRRFSAEDDSPGAPLTIILSHDYWQSRFAGDLDVVGRTLRVDGETREIVGVMPAEPRFLRFDPAMYLPFQFDRATLYVGNFSYQALARLKPGVTIESANADVDRMVPLAFEKFTGGMPVDMLESAQFGAYLRPLKQDVVGNIGEVLWVLLGTVGIILLIACANVANLFLVRAEGREREMAVRTAMGASAGAIGREFLKESLVLGVLGGIAGLALALGGLELLGSLLGANLPRMDEIGLSLPVLMFTLVISVFAAGLFGMFPVLKFANGRLVDGLKEGGRGGSAGKEKHRARNTLVVAQMALALVLLVGSGLMIRSFIALRQVDPGFRNPDEVLTVRLYIPSTEVEDPTEMTRTHQAIADRLAALPGVSSVGLSSSITMDGWDSNDAVWMEDFPIPDDQVPPIRRFKWVGENYLETMQIPMVAGRVLDWRDSYDLNRVVMVTENFTREYWDQPSQALGRRIATMSPDGANWREIVGVVGNVRDDGLDQDPTAVVYWPMLTPNVWTGLPGEQSELQYRRTMRYAIRSDRVGTAGFLPEVRDAIWSVNPNLPLADVRTLREFMDRSMSRTSFTLLMLVIAATVALLLGAIGIYGVISYVVNQRTRELGVRMALGAEGSDVRGMVLRKGLALALIGVVVGLGAALGLTRLMEALLYGVSPLDPLTFVSVALALTAVALAASYFPARKASKVDPVVAIRFD
ncbi:MAG: ABC transporter permease [Gemmatimonadetes bacterium]|nr:ABC transporter permease [Gemmatimonadota bacterium]